MNLHPVQSSNIAANGSDDPLLAKSLIFINENLYENGLCLEMLSSHVFMSRCYLSRLFKYHLGIGFKEYIMSKRIEAAKAMLEKGDSVTDVCFAVGYGDLSYFGKVFKRLAGMNAGHWRWYVENHRAANL